MKGKVVYVSIPREVIREAEKRGISLEELKNFVKESVEMDVMLLFSGLKEKDVKALSKKIGRELWKKL